MGRFVRSPLRHQTPRINRRPPPREAYRLAVKRGGFALPPVRVDRSNTRFSGKTFIVIGFGQGPRSERDMMSTIAGDLAQEAIRTVHQEFVVAIRGSSGKGADATEEASKVLKEYDQQQERLGRVGGAKTLEQQRSAEGKITSMLETWKPTLREQLSQSFSLPRDQEGRTIYFDESPFLFYVIDGQTRKRIYVYVDLEFVEPLTKCTVDYPTGYLPRLITTPRPVWSAG